MKYLNTIIQNFKLILWLSVCCGLLQAEVVITEFFILQANGTHVPQYIELYNKSSNPENLKDWTIKTLNADGEIILTTPVAYCLCDGNSQDCPGGCVSVFTQINDYDDSNGNELYDKDEPIIIDPFGYFIIASTSCNYSSFGCYFYNDRQSDIDAFYLYLPLYHLSK